MKNLSKFFKKNWSIFFLLILVSFYCVANFIWLYLDTLPPAWDQSGHMLLSLKYYRLTLQEIPALKNIGDFFSISHYYPPFFHLSSIPVIFLLGFTEDNLILVNFFYLIILIISLLAMAKLLFNERVGVVSVLLVLFYPLIYAMFREYLIDFALVGMVTAVQFLILKSKGGIERPWNFLLGIVAGFTLLTKPVAIIFFAPLWIFISWRNIKKRKDFLSLSMAVAVCLAVALPWNLFAFSDMLKLNSYWQNIAKMVEGDPQGFFASTAWYNYALKNTLISQNLLFFLIVGFMLFLIFDRRIEIFITLILCIIPAYFFLVLMPNKDARYVMPILPACTLLAIGGIDALGRKSIRNSIYFIIIVIGFVQFNNLSFAIPPFLVKENTFFYNHVLLRQDWKIKEILKYIESQVGKKHISVGILPDCQYFNPPVFMFYANLFELPYSVEGFGNSSIDLEEIKKYDIFITKYPKIAVDYVAHYRNIFYEEMDKLGYDALGFDKAVEFELPDNSKAFVYHKKQDI